MDLQCMFKHRSYLLFFNLVAPLDQELYIKFVDYPVLVVCKGCLEQLHDLLNIISLGKKVDLVLEPFGPNQHGKTVQLLHLFSQCSCFVEVAQSPVERNKLLV